MRSVMMALHCFDENTVAGDNLLLAEQRHPQAAKAPKTMRWMWKEECLKTRDPQKMSGNGWFLECAGLRGLNFTYIYLACGGFVSACEVPLTGIPKNENWTWTFQKVSKKPCFFGGSSVHCLGCALSLRPPSPCIGAWWGPRCSDLLKSARILDIW